MGSRASERRIVFTVADARSMSPTVEMADRELEQVKRFAKILDRYMVDPVVGLVLPGVGDLLGSLLGLYIVGMALRRRVSTVIILRMLLNLAIDAGIGVIPGLGDIADVLFRANEMNLKLLVERDASGGKATTRDWLIVGGLAFIAVAAIGFSIYAMVALIHAISR